MIMELPEKFKMPFVKISNGQLIIFQLVRYEDLIYELTYALKKEECYYCGKRLKLKNRTLDHCYPRAMGGVSIVNNLVPSCSKCNTEKMDMTVAEFDIWKNLLSESERKRYLKELNKINAQIRKSDGYKLPLEWGIKMMKIDEIHHIQSPYDMRGKKYYRISEFYNQYKKFPRPIIVDKEFKLLDGYNIILFAKDFNIKEVPTIVLENVVVEKY